MKTLKSDTKRAEYIARAFAKPDLPFHWAQYEEGDIPDPKEASGYRTTRRGAFQSQVVLKAFAAFYGGSATRSPPPTKLQSWKDRPIGALAISCTAVSLYFFSVC
jgi:hypothetical protein